MIPAAIIAAILLLVAAFVGGYYFGKSGQAAATVQADLKDEQEATKGAEIEREKIEAETKAKLAKLPSETTTELAQDIWGKP